ncbi:putative membrane protein [Escherichia coli P0298942.8]|nr:putative membrane protein [Escherichia coli P0298942.8]
MAIITLLLPFLLSGHLLFGCYFILLTFTGITHYFLEL